MFDYFCAPLRIRFGAAKLNHFKYVTNCILNIKIFTYFFCSVSLVVMIITRFPKGSEYSFYACVELFRQLREHKQVASSVGTQITKSWIAAKIKSLKNVLDLNDYRSLFGDPAKNNIDFLEEACDVNIFIWTKKTRRDPLRLAWESNRVPKPSKNVNLFSETFDVHGTVDFDNMALIFDIGKFAQRHNYDAQNNESRMRSMTFFQAVVKEKYPNLVGSSYEKKVEEFRLLWPKNQLHLSDIKEFFKIFGIGLQLWDIQTSSHKRETKKMYDTYWKKKMILAIPDFNPNKAIDFDSEVVYVKDYSLLNHFSCAKKNCFFATNDRNKHAAHVVYCRDSTLINCKQIKHGRSLITIEQELFEEGILPSSTFENFYCVSYDIECVMAASTNPELVNVGSIHRLVSIGLKSNLPNDSESCIVRNDMTAESLKTAVKTFVDLLQSIRIKMIQQLPTEIYRGYETYYGKLKDPNFRKMGPKEKTNILKKHKFLKDLFALKCYGWNTERYDVNVLIGPLMDYFSKSVKEFQKMTCVKRGTGYMGRV